MSETVALQMTYQPELERIDIALKAVYRLFYLKKWNLLEQLHFSRVHNVRLLEMYQEAVLDYGKLKTRDQAFALVLYCPDALDAALELLRMYQAQPERTHYLSK